MAEYKDLKSKGIVVSDEKAAFNFPATGAKMLLKSRPPLAKDVKTD